jgi:peptide/nickel transport system substrate-binding protein
MGLAGASEPLRAQTLGFANATGRIEPRLARSWSRSPDGHTWTFTIAEHLRLHGGQEATAGTVADLLRSALREPLNLQSYTGLQEIEEVRAVDAKRFVVRSRNPRLGLLDELVQLSLGEGSEKLATGPFRIDKLDDSGFSASAFHEYFQGRPGVERVEFRTFPSARSAWSALMRDEVDALYGVSREATEFMERDPSVRLYTFLRPYVATLFLNVNSSQLQDRNVRLGLSRAIHRKAILESAYQGHGRVADGPLWPEHWAITPGVRTAAFDPQSAIALFHSGGDRGQKRIRVRCLVTNAEMQPFERMALVLQKQLFDAGVDMELQLVPVREFIGRLASGDFETALFEYAAGTPSWVHAFWHSPRPGAPVWIKHGYSAADAELDAMQNARDEEEMKRAVAAVYKKMADDPPAIFIAWPEVARAVSTRFEVPVGKGRDIMGGNMWLWRPAKQK